MIPGSSFFEWASFVEIIIHFSRFQQKVFRIRPSRFVSETLFRVSRGGKIERGIIFRFLTRLFAFASSFFPRQATLDSKVAVLGRVSPIPVVRGFHVEKLCIRPNFSFSFYLLALSKLHSWVVFPFRIALNEYPSEGMQWICTTLKNILSVDYCCIFPFFSRTSKNHIERFLMAYLS